MSVSKRKEIFSLFPSPTPQIPLDIPKTSQLNSQIIEKNNKSVSNISLASTQNIVSNPIEFYQNLKIMNIANIENLDPKIYIHDPHNTIEPLGGRLESYEDVLNEKFVNFEHFPQKLQTTTVYKSKIEQLNTDIFEDWNKIIINIEDYHSILAKHKQNLGSFAIFALNFLKKILRKIFKGNLLLEEILITKQLFNNMLSEYNQNLNDILKTLYSIPINKENIIDMVSKNGEWGLFMLNMGTILEEIHININKAKIYIHKVFPLKLKSDFSLDKNLNTYNNSKKDKEKYNINVFSNIENKNNIVNYKQKKIVELLEEILYWKGILISLICETYKEKEKDFIDKINEKTEFIQEKIEKDINYKHSDQILNFIEKSLNFLTSNQTNFEEIENKFLEENQIFIQLFNNLYNKFFNIWQGLRLSVEKIVKINDYKVRKLDKLDKKLNFILENEIPNQSFPIIKESDFLKKLSKLPIKLKKYKNELKLFQNQLKNDFFIKVSNQMIQNSFNLLLNLKNKYNKLNEMSILLRSEGITNILNSNLNAELGIQNIMYRYYEIQIFIEKLTPFLSIPPFLEAKKIYSQQLSLLEQILMSFSETKMVNSPEFKNKLGNELEKSYSLLKKYQINNTPFNIIENDNCKEILDIIQKLQNLIKIKGISKEKIEEIKNLIEKLNIVNNMMNEANIINQLNLFSNEKFIEKIFEEINLENFIEENKNFNDLSINVIIIHIQSYLNLVSKYSKNLIYLNYYNENIEKIQLYNDLFNFLHSHFENFHNEYLKNNQIIDLNSLDIQIQKIKKIKNNEISNFLLKHLTKYQKSCEKTIEMQSKLLYRIKIRSEIKELESNYIILKDQLLLSKNSLSKKTELLQKIEEYNLKISQIKESLQKNSQNTNDSRFSVSELKSIVPNLSSLSKSLNIISNFILIFKLIDLESLNINTLIIERKNDFGLETTNRLKELGLNLHKLKKRCLKHKIEIREELMILNNEIMNFVDVFIEFLSLLYDIIGDWDNFNSVFNEFNYEVNTYEDVWFEAFELFMSFISRISDVFIKIESIKKILIEKINKKDIFESVPHVIFLLNEPIIELIRNYMHGFDIEFLKKVYPSLKIIRSEHINSLYKRLNAFLKDFYLKQPSVEIGGADILNRFIDEITVFGVEIDKISMVFEEASELSYQSYIRQFKDDEEIDRKLKLIKIIGINESRKRFNKCGFNVWGEFIKTIEGVLNEYLENKKKEKLKNINVYLKSIMVIKKNHALIPEQIDLIERIDELIRFDYKITEKI